MVKLRAEQDAYGRMIYDYHCGHNHDPEIIERDDGFISTSSGPAAYFTSYAEWGNGRQAIDLARGRVLDIGCGAGRIALHVQAKGHHVLAIDISPLAIKACRLRGVRHTKVASITDANPRWGTFDTIVMFGHNFGLFGSAAGARRLLRRFARMTPPDARILAESLDPYQTDEPWHRNYHRRNRRRGRMAGQARIRARYKGWASLWFDYLLVSVKEMRRIVEGTGWRVSRVFESGGPSYVAVIERVKG
jgi:SAM-dependent methyltransferase